MARPAKSSTGITLRLYIAGDSPNSVRAIENIKLICANHFAETHSLEIVDMLLDPMRALADKIVVSPTLLKLHPLPVRRVVGSLSDKAEVIAVLRPG